MADTANAGGNTARSASGRGRTAPPASDPFHEETAKVVEAVGDVIGYWGFRKILGRVWTTLFLSEEPLDAEGVRARLQVSAGSVSTALNELERWGVVRRVWRPGERRNLYEPETDLWKMISRVFSERERLLFRSAESRIAAALESLRPAARAGGARAARAAFLAGRMERLHAVAVLGTALLEAFLATRRIDASAIAELRELPASAKVVLRLVPGLRKVRP